MKCTKFEMAPTPPGQIRRAVVWCAGQMFLEAQEGQIEGVTEMGSSLLVRGGPWSSRHNPLKGEFNPEKEKLIVFCAEDDEPEWTSEEALGAIFGLPLDEGEKESRLIEEARSLLRDGRLFVETSPSEEETVWDKILA